MIVIKRIKAYFKSLFDRIFPIKVISFTNQGKLLKHRDKFYILRISNIKISNVIGKIKKWIKSFLPEYGYISFALIIIFISLISFIFKENFITIAIIKILSIHKITSWIGDLATIFVILLAIHPIHHKSRISISEFKDSRNFSIQLLNRGSNSSFIRLHHIYISNKNRSQVYASSIFDLNKYYSKYTKWTPLSSYSLYTFWIVNNNTSCFRHMYKEYCRWVSLLKNSNMHYIVFEFSINDHHFDIISKAFDINKLSNKFCNNH